MPVGQGNISGSPSTAPPVPQGTRLLLIADDLTGALDAGAQFVGLSGPVSVHWRQTAAAGSLAIDSGARELSGDEAEAAVRSRLVGQRLDDATLAYAKLDSLLRGHPAREISSWLSLGRFDRCLVAPAFPAQARITRSGRQYRRQGEDWAPVATDLVAELEKLGVAATLRRPGDAAPAGVSIWDAESDADLDAVVSAGRATGGRVLWSGAGGLAAALARSAGILPAKDLAIRRPLLGLIGSDQPIAFAQLDACTEHVLTIEDGGPATVRRICERLAMTGVALVRMAVAANAFRIEAAARIAREFGRLLDAVAPPATLLVAGGETLRAVCDALRADHLELAGEIEPGVPVSRLRGGRFPGVAVVSKSGAFGDPNLIKRLIAVDPLSRTGVPA